MGLVVLFSVSMPRCIRPGHKKYTHGTSIADHGGDDDDEGGDSVCDYDDDVRRRCAT